MQNNLLWDKLNRWYNKIPMNHNQSRNAKFLKISQQTKAQCYFTMFELSENPWEGLFVHFAYGHFLGVLSLLRL